MLSTSKHQPWLSQLQRRSISPGSATATACGTAVQQRHMCSYEILVPNCLSWKLTLSISSGPPAGSCIHDLRQRRARLRPCPACPMNTQLVLYGACIIHLVQYIQCTSHCLGEGLSVTRPQLSSHFHALRLGCSISRGSTGCCVGNCRPTIKAQLGACHCK
jgi:hypothetical protein